MADTIPSAWNEGQVTDARYFSAYAERSLANGYSVIPIVPGHKHPSFADWRSACWSRGSLEWVRRLASESPQASIGLACGRFTVAFDLDAEHPATVRIFRDIVEGVCGKTPLVRIGKPPKVALVYRSAEPIVALRLPRIDILGLGTELVAYGMHPTAGVHYRWIEGAAPHLTSLESIPAVTNAQCEAAASEVARRVFGTRFRGFVFDLDVAVIARIFSFRGQLRKLFFARLFLGAEQTQRRAIEAIRVDRLPPGCWGFVMHPVVEGGYSSREIAKRLDRGEI